MSDLTRIHCNPVDTKFLILYIRMREYTRESLNLVKFNSSYKICDQRIRNDILKEFEEFKSLQIDISSYFNVNIMTASCKRRSNEFTLKQIKFDQEKEVKIGTKFSPNWNQIINNIEST